MAYPRPAYDPRSPHDSERSRMPWDTIQRPHYPSMPSPSHHTAPSPSLLDPESESSDVSDTPGEDYQSRIHSTYPTPLPPTTTKHMLESLDAIEGRLRDLQRVEDLNINKQDQLKIKRARKDDRIRRKREAQDMKIKAIMDVRARHDERIGRRRQMEDDAFERCYHDLEQEENNLRRRQKRLKRGLPADDMGLGSRISSASMSPPGPTYSNIPPPPKRHQTGPPGQNDSPVTTNSRPVSHSTPSAPGSTGPNPPPYAFLQSGHPPTSAPYGRSPTISNSPSNASGPFQPIPRSHQPSVDPNPFSNVNGHPPSPHTSRPQPPLGPVPSILNTAPPPRPPPSTYDTRPPPPAAASGFAPINTPHPSGFAPINPRNTATPPTPASVPLPKLGEHERPNGHIRPYVSEGTPTGSATNTSSKRTPSTTHPYQASEAFANRHHHCERVDHLNRGVWTSYGAGGTKEMPTGPPQEMYLRCNHDGCRRIDWKTVHGLQCHIVKSHEQPKGTIGSLEKALDRYGVPVSEVIAYEREHGDGTGGTMADPKNLKTKTKGRDSIEKVDGLRRSYGAPPNSTAYRTNLAMSLGNATQPYHGSPASLRSLPHEETEDSETDSRNTPVESAAKPPQPPSSFPAVNGTWSTIPGPRPVEPKDHVMKDAPANPQPPSTGTIPTTRTPGFWKLWPETPENKKAESMNDTPAATLGPAPGHIPPVATPVPPPSDYRPLFTPPASTPVTQTPLTPSAQSHPVTKIEKSPTEEKARDAQAPNTALVQTAVQDQPQSASTDVMKDAPTTASSAPEPTPARANTPAPVKENTAIQEIQKERENPKAETVEPSRTEPKSPETMGRRASIIGVRRIYSRRSSVAAKAEKEREKEREEAAAAEAEREKQRLEKEEIQKPGDVDQDKEMDREEDQDKEGDSDDPDTITAAVPSTVSKDKDKEKDNRENKTTPRRHPNGRFVRKR